MHSNRLSKHKLRQRLQRFDVATLTARYPDYRRAAVALVIVDEGHGAQVRGLAKPLAWSADPALILTRRPLTMRRHAGQWALPGGRLDGDETIEQAALRELHEEVGLRLPPSAILGRLDDFATRSGFVMSPLVIWGGGAWHLRADPTEVASIHRIRLAEFNRADAPLLSAQTKPPQNSPASGQPPNATAPVLRMPVGTDHIAAPTAALLYQFRELCLNGRATRVAHYEQPVFAWT